MRKLQDNPHDSEALKLMYNSQKDVCNPYRNVRNLFDILSFVWQMSSWANSKFVPGQFTGSTGANVLSARELTSGFQAWAKRVSIIFRFTHKHCWTELARYILTVVLCDLTYRVFCSGFAWNKISPIPQIGEFYFEHRTLSFLRGESLAGMGHQTRPAKVSPDIDEIFSLSLLYWWVGMNDFTTLIPIRFSFRVCLKERKNDPTKTFWKFCRHYEFSIALRLHNV